MSETWTMGESDEREAERSAAEKLERVTRHVAFITWLHKAVELRGHGVQLPPPHELDDYEIRRAVEAGLYGRD